MGQEIQSAIQSGKEVTFHERGINAHGFSGYGYIITDPDTGGGAYLIEGKGNGGFLKFLDKNAALISLFAALLGGIATPFTLWWFLALTIAFAVVAAGLILYLDALDGRCGAAPLVLYFSLAVVALGLGVVAVGLAQVFVVWFLGFFADGAIRSATEGRC